MIVRGVQMFSGLGGADSSALQEVTDLCGLRLGLQGGVEQNLEGAAMGAATIKPAGNRDHLRLVSGHRDGR